MSGVFRPFAPWVVGGVYGIGLVVVAAVVSGAADGGDSLRLWWSTDLDNLTSSPARAILVLVGSAFVPEESAGWWALFALVGFVVLGRRVGAGAAAGLACAAHLLATGVSEGLLAVRIGRGDVDPVARSIVDVGPSFVVVAVLVAGVVYGRRWERVVAAVGFGVLVPYLFTGLTSLDVAAVGHVVAIAVAVGAGGLLVRRVRRAEAELGPVGVTG